MLTSYFCVSKLWILSSKTDTDKCLQVSKSYGATSLCKMLLDNGQRIEYGMKLLNQYWHVWQYQAVRLIVGKWSSMQWRNA